MKCSCCIILALAIGGCIGCNVTRYNDCMEARRMPPPPPPQTVVVSPYRPAPPAQIVVAQPAPVERVVTRTRSRSLLGHLVVGTTLILADCVSLVFPIQEETEELREYYHRGGF